MQTNMQNEACSIDYSSTTAGMLEYSIFPISLTVKSNMFLKDNQHYNAFIEKGQKTLHLIMVTARVRRGKHIPSVCLTVSRAEHPSSV